MESLNNKQVDINKTDISWIKKELKEISSYLKGLIFLLLGQALTFIGGIVYFLISKGS